MSSPIPAFERNPYRRELDVEIVASGEAADGEPAWAVLDDTLIYPEGGGQPSDRGHLGAAEVAAAERCDGAIRHHLDRPVATGPARLILDWPRRHDHMQQHTAQHLLTAIALELYGWSTIAFHLGEEVASIDLETTPPGLAEVEALEDVAAEEIARGRAVSSRRVDQAEFERLHQAGVVRSRRLPEGHVGDVRLVEIEGLDVNTCGGTHLASTREIAVLKLLSVESAHGGCRLVWVAGDRVRRRLADGERRTAELRRLFETSTEELSAVAALKLEQLKRSERQLRALEERYAAAMAQRLAAPDGPLDAHFDDADGGFLQRVARAFAGQASNRLILLTASGERGDFFALAAGPDSRVDLATIGPAVAEILAGRGGGSGSLFQGKAGGLEDRSDAVVAARAALRTAGG